MNKDSAKRIVDIVDTIQKEEENGKNAMQIDNIGKCTQVCALATSYLCFEYRQNQHPSSFRDRFTRTI
jgi:hypothetical protein